MTCLEDKPNDERQQEESFHDVVAGTRRHGTSPLCLPVEVRTASGASRRRDTCRPLLHDTLLSDDASHVRTRHVVEQWTMGVAQAASLGANLGGPRPSIWGAPPYRRAPDGPAAGRAQTTQRGTKDSRFRLAHWEGLQRGPAGSAVGRRRCRRPPDRPAGVQHNRAQAASMRACRGSRCIRHGPPGANPAGRPVESSCRKGGLGSSAGGAARRLPAGDSAGGVGTSVREGGGGVQGGACLDHAWPGRGAFGVLLRH